MGSALRQATNWAERQADAYRHGEQRPMRGYVGAMGVYSALVGAAAVAARLLGKHAPARTTPWDVVLLGVATQKLSRLLARDPVTSPLRAPFVKYEGTAGPGEVSEQVREHGDVKHAVGELSSCPFCMAQWVATGFVTGTVLAPRATRLAATTFAAIAVSDTLQLAYAALENAAQ
jgi:hypothetical protein